MLAVDYVRSTQAGALPRLARPTPMGDAGVMAMDAATRASLEILASRSGAEAGSLLASVKRTVSPAGARLLAAWISAPLNQLTPLQDRHTAWLALCDANQAEPVRAALRGAPDVSRALGRIALGRAGPRDLAAIARAGRCVVCRSPVHSGNYRRKLRGPFARRLGEKHCWRFSLCCSRDGCRKRKKPPSLRFLDRKGYLAAMVVLVAAMQHGATAMRVAKLSQMFGVSRRTVARWRMWWLTVFANGPFWHAARALIMPPVDEQRLPASLLDR